MPPTVNELLDWYLRDYVGTKAVNTAAQYVWVFPLFRREIGDVLVTDVTPARLRALRQALLARYTPGTVRVYLYILSGAFTAAIEEYEVLDLHPFRRIRFPSPPPDRVRFLSDEERERLLGACQRSHNRALYPIVLLAIATGGRKNELRALRWSQVDLVITETLGVLRLQRSKNKAPKVLPVVGMALEVLRRWAETQRLQPWVFPGVDGRRPTHIDRAWDRAVNRAQVWDFHFHDLRHTCGSYLAMSGASLRDIAEVLGHKNTQMSVRYTHLTLPYTTGVVERMTARFLAPEPPAPPAP